MTGVRSGSIFTDLERVSREGGVARFASQGGRRMKARLRFADLKARNIAGSWAALARLIEKHGFPRGRLLSDRVRVWSEDELDAWLQNRPTKSRRPLQGRAKELVAARGKRHAAAE